MEIPPYQKLRWFTSGCLIVLAAAILVLVAIVDNKETAVISAADNLEVKSSMLRDAMDYVGVCSAHEAANVWAQGIKLRNAAMQYAMMTKTLKEQYTKQWEETAPEWVTGVSSPWISKYQIMDARITEEQGIISIGFTAETSTGKLETLEAKLTIVPENSFWRITDISMDKGLFPYAGFKEED
jgi:hypothetical protein